MGYTAPVVYTYKYGEDMIGMCIKLSGYVQISHAYVYACVAVFRKAVIVQCCKLVKISTRI